MTTSAPAPGLSDAEVEQRRAQGLTNEVSSRTSRSVWSIARANLFTLFNAILLVAIVTVLLVGNWRDAVFGGVMVLNAVIGIASEWRAKRTLDALAIVDAPRVLVRRNGTGVEVPGGEVVLDDIVELRLGDQVPVDGEVLETRGLEVDESMLTGESVPVRKEVGERVLAGTAVVAGSSTVRARAVGEQVYAQDITRQARRFSLASSEIQQGINKVLRVVSIAIMPVVVLMVWSQTRIAASGEDAWKHALVLAVSSVVGMIPQGLVLLTSMNFALGSATLARRGVLVQELPAVEVLARVDALCLDKTGTLTTGGIRMREVRHLGGGGEVPAEERLALAELSRDRTNATAQALAVWLESTPPSSRPTPPPASGTGWEVAFSSARKWSACGDARGSWFLGAPEILLAGDDEGVRAALEEADGFAQQGLRVVCLVWARPQEASEELPARREPRALLVLEEDIREDAAQTLDYFREQGVRVRVISGDNPTTVATIASQVGLRNPDGGELRSCDARTLPEDLTSAEFVTAIAEHDVFGRVTPEQKRAMVHALQSQGHAVAMTGDGVNDTLALKDADLGIAMGNGAAATKAVAQIVLVDGKFSVLPGVVAEGRRIIANMERVSSLFLAKTTYAAVIAILCAVFAWTYPFLPRHFTYIDAFTIGIPAFFIALGPNRRRYVPGFLRRTLSLAVPTGLYLSVAALVAYAVVGMGTVSGQTAATLALMTGALWLLSVTARPLVSWRVALLVLMALASVVGVLIPVVRTFFALQWLTGDRWLVILTCGALACLLIEVTHRLFSGRRHAEAERLGSPDVQVVPENAPAPREGVTRR